MLTNLLTGLGVTVACLLLQSVLVIAAIRFYRRYRPQRERPSFSSNVVGVSGVMLLLLLGNLGQVALWAQLFKALGEFPTFDDAFYHSAVNFATLGYGDVVMSPDHRLLGPLEAINGALMIGVTTAALLTAFQDTVRNYFSLERRSDR